MRSIDIAKVVCRMVIHYQSKMISCVTEGVSSKESFVSDIVGLCVLSLPKLPRVVSLILIDDVCVLSLPKLPGDFFLNLLDDVHQFRYTLLPKTEPLMVIGLLIRYSVCTVRYRGVKNLIMKCLQQ